MFENVLHARWTKIIFSEVFSRFICDCSWSISHECLSVCLSLSVSACVRLCVRLCSRHHASRNCEHLAHGLHTHTHTHDSWWRRHYHNFIGHRPPFRHPIHRLLTVPAHTKRFLSRRRRPGPISGAAEQLARQERGTTPLIT